MSTIADRVGRYPGGFPRWHSSTPVALHLQEITVSGFSRVGTPDVHQPQQNATYSDPPKFTVNKQQIPVGPSKDNVIGANDLQKIAGRSRLSTDYSGLDGSPTLRDRHVVVRAWNWAVAKGTQVAQSKGAKVFGAGVTGAGIGSGIAALGSSAGIVTGSIVFGQAAIPIPVVGAVIGGVVGVAGLGVVWLVKHLKNKQQNQEPPRQSAINSYDSHTHESLTQASTPVSLHSQGTQLTDQQINNFFYGSDTPDYELTETASQQVQTIEDEELQSDIPQAKSRQSVDDKDKGNLNATTDESNQTSTLQTDDEPSNVAPPSLDMSLIDESDTDEIDHERLAPPTRRHTDSEVPPEIVNPGRPHGNDHNDSNNSTNDADAMSDTTARKEPKSNDNEASMNQKDVEQQTNVPPLPDLNGSHGQDHKDNIQLQLSVPADTTAEALSKPETIKSSTADTVKHDVADASSHKVAYSAALVDFYLGEEDDDDDDDDNLNPQSNESKKLATQVRAELHDSQLLMSAKPDCQSELGSFAGRVALRAVNDGQAKIARTHAAHFKRRSSSNTRNGTGKSAAVINDTLLALKRINGLQSAEVTAQQVEDAKAEAVRAVQGLLYTLKPRLCTADVTERYIDLKIKPPSYQQGANAIALYATAQHLNENGLDGDMIPPQTYTACRREIVTQVIREAHKWNEYDSSMKTADFDAAYEQLNKRLVADMSGTVMRALANEGDRFDVNEDSLFTND